MAKAILSLGTNLEPRLNNLRDAINFLQKLSKKPIKVSSIYETEPYQMDSNNYFLNTAVLIETSEKPEDLLTKILDYERQVGRLREKGRMLDRPIDIDILFYDDLTIDSQELKIPHPAISHRNFVLLPLLDLIPDLIHPILNKTVWEMYNESPDLSEVILLEEKLKAI